MIVFHFSEHKNDGRYTGHLVTADHVH